MLKFYRNIITKSVYMDIIPPMCPMYWEEISYREYMKTLEQERLEAEAEDK